MIVTASSLHWFLIKLITWKKLNRVVLPPPGSRSHGPHGGPFQHGKNHLLNRVPLVVDKLVPARTRYLWSLGLPMLSFPFLLSGNNESFLPCFCFKSHQHM